MKLNECIPNTARMTTVYNEFGGVGHIDMPEGFTKTMIYHPTDKGFKTKEEIPAGEFMSRALDTYLWLVTIGGDFLTTNTFEPESRLVGVNLAGALTTYSFEGDGLRRIISRTDEQVDPPVDYLTTIIHDGDTPLQERT